MFLKQVTAVVLAGLIGAQGAAIDTLARDQPLQQEQQRGPKLVLLDSKIIPAGNLTTWVTPGTEGTRATIDDFAPSPVQRRCGSNQVECGSTEPGPTTVCTSLIDSLDKWGVSNTPLSICLEQSGFQCCISWAIPVPGLIQSNLINAAKDARKKCGGSGFVSAIVRDVKLHGVCTNQCISGEPGVCA